MGNKGQYGIALGAAAFLFKKHGTTPRGIYKAYIRELQDIPHAMGHGVLARNS